MEEQKFQKRLLHYDDAGFTRQMNDFQRNCQILNQIAEKYEELFSEKITQKQINQIFERDFDSLLKAAKTSIGKKIKSDLLAEVSLKLFEEKFSVFVVEVSRFLTGFRKQLYRSPTPRRRLCYGSALIQKANFLFRMRPLRKSRSEARITFLRPENRNYTASLSSWQNSIMKYLIH